jgi:hypothetical protein
MHRFALDADPASRSHGRVLRPASEIARLNAEVARLRALCRRQATALERLTAILRRMRRGALALRHQNGELADQVEQVRVIKARQAAGPSTSGAHDETA